MPKSESKYKKYLSPIDRVEVEKSVEARIVDRNAAHSRSPSTSTAASNSERTEKDEDARLKNMAKPSTSTHRAHAYSKNQYIDELIELTSRATVLDMDHLPARAQLGYLYSLKGELALAEHWLERACTHIKYRGVGGGISSVFGGATSAWGWLSWKLLGDVLKEEGRFIDAKKSILFSLELQKFHCIRGYDCLPRYAS